MLVSPTDINIPTQENQTGEKSPAFFAGNSNDIITCSGRDGILTRTLPPLEHGKSTHYYSFKNFNLVRLILHLLKQTGPAHIFMSSYSFSPRSIESLNNQIEKGLILSFRLLIDNRVRTISPKPFEMIMNSFEYRCSSIHAKVALIWNDEWKISVVTSQNATDNPKMERGTIHTNPSIFDFDYKIMTDEFNQGTT